VKSLPEQIERAMSTMRPSPPYPHPDARADEDFTMMVGKREFSGKGAREEAGTRLNAVVISCVTTPQVRANSKASNRGRGSQFKDGELIFSSGTKKHTRPISTRTTPWARFRAFRAHPARSGPPRRGGTARNRTTEKALAIIVPNWAGLRA